MTTWTFRGGSLDGATTVLVASGAWGTLGGGRRRIPGPWQPENLPRIELGHGASEPECLSPQGDNIPAFISPAFVRLAGNSDTASVIFGAVPSDPLRDGWFVPGDRRRALPGLPATTAPNACGYAPHGRRLLVRTPGAEVPTAAAWWYPGHPSPLAPGVRGRAPDLLLVTLDDMRARTLAEPAPPGALVATLTALVPWTEGTIPAETFAGSSRLPAWEPGEIRWCLEGLSPA